MPTNSNDMAGDINRVMDALREYAGQDAQLKIANPRGHSTDNAALQLKYLHYSHLRKALKKGANPAEKRSLRYIQHERAKLRAQLRPTTVRSVLYTPIIDAIRSFVGGHYGLYKRHTKALLNEHTDAIRAYNLTELQEKLKNAGFNMSVDRSLQKMIDLNLPEFHIRYSDPVRCKNADFVLHFKKIPGSDLYYFEKFDATARPTLKSVLNNNPSTVRQSFSLLDGLMISPIEAANLVNGRSIYRQMDGKENWLSLDQTKRDQQQGIPYRAQTFDLEKALEKFPITQLANPKQRNFLIHQLKNGSQPEVTIPLHGRLEKFRIEVAPKSKSLFFFNMHNQPVNVDSLKDGREIDRAQKLIRKVEDGVIDMKKARAIKIS